MPTNTYNLYSITTSSPASHFIFVVPFIVILCDKGFDFFFFKIVKQAQKD